MAVSSYRKCLFRMKRFLLLIIYGVIFPPVGFSQDGTSVKKGYQQEDIKDWLFQVGWVKKKPEKKNFLLIIPVVASNPTAGFIYGAGLTYAFQTPATDTHVSTLTSNATYSTKSLLNLNIKSNLFVMGGRLVLNGDWRYLQNTETTYGLGTARYNSGYIGLNGYVTSTDSLGQPLEYTQVRVHEVASWELLPAFFAGIGLHYDRYYDITDAELTAKDTSRSFQYQYSLKHGFNPLQYTTMGFSLNFLLDSRDNQIDAYKGSYANVNYRINLTALGSAKNSGLLLTEYRSYLSLDRQHRNILGFWYYGNFVVGGEAPYLLLPALGYDQRQRTGRGYTFGRFRGEDLVYGETEYRFPISPHTGILGGDLFLNCTSTSDKDNHIDLLEYLRPAYGGGLRLMMDKRSRVRIEVDAGVAGKSVGLYFGAQETF